MCARSQLTTSSPVNKSAPNTDLTKQNFEHLASKSSKRHSIHWAETRQGSFSNYLTKSRKGNNLYKTLNDALPSVTAENEVPLEIKTSASATEVHSKILTNGVIGNVSKEAIELPAFTKRKTRKDGVVHKVHFTDEIIKDISKDSEEAETYSSVETVRIHSGGEINRGNSITTKDFLKDKISLKKIGVKAPQSILCKSFSSSSVPTSIPQLTNSFTSIPIDREHNNNIVDSIEWSTTTSASTSLPLQLSNANCTVSRDGTGTSDKPMLITRVGGVQVQQPGKTPEYLKQDSSVFPIVKDKTPERLSNSFQRATEDSSHYDEIIPQISSLNESIGNKVVGSKSILSSKLKIQSVPSDTVHSIVDSKNSFAETSSVDSDNENKKVNFSYNGHPDHDNKTSIIDSCVSTSFKDTVNTASSEKHCSKTPKCGSTTVTNPLRFLRRGMTLPPLPSTKLTHKHHSGQTQIDVLRVKFLSELPCSLPPELSDYLYLKMKGSTEHLLVRACKLAEEDQVLRLIEELKTDGDVCSSFFNETDKTGKVSEYLRDYKK